MNRTTPLAATDDLTVNRFDHPAGEVHRDPDLEVAEYWSVAFVESGAFELCCEGRQVQLEAGSVLLTRPGLEFSCRHASACPDDVCLSVRFEQAAVAETPDPWHQRGRMIRPRGSPRLALVRHRLSAAVAETDTFATERWAIAALDALLADAAAERPRGPYAVRRDDLDAVMEVCRAIEQQPEAHLSVASRARVVQMSSPRLTHAFRRYVGVSPHHYVIRWRLVAATNLLDASCSVTEACYRAGFENLSHFCRTFLLTLGTRPSGWRSLPLPERRRKVQAMLRNHL
jgi:AraC family transcriptional regulator